MNEGLRQVLRMIERTILPRTIHLRTANGQLQIEVSAQRLLLCPRSSNGAFLLDSELHREAPEAWEVLRRGDQTVRASLEVLQSARGPLLRHCARALAKLTAGIVVVEHIVQAQKTAGRHGGALPLLNFDARELAAALPSADAPSAIPDLPPHAVSNGRDIAPPPAPPPAAPAVIAEAAPPQQGREVSGLAEAFYRHLASSLPDAWLFELSGQPAGSPPRARPGDIAEMAKAIPPVRDWREFLGEPEGPLMVIFFEPSQEGLRCMAIDSGHAALVSGSGLELGFILTAWRAAQQNVARTGRADGE
jgi:hypothetical protein